MSSLKVRAWARLIATDAGYLPLLSADFIVEFFEEPFTTGPQLDMTAK